MLRIIALKIDCIFMYINSADSQPARKKQKRQTVTKKGKKTVTKKEKKTTKKKVRQLKVQERRAVANSIDKPKLVAFICHSVPDSLVPSLFPERMELWKSLKDTDELKSFIHCAADDYLRFYDQHSKGKEKYANLYLTWLKYISSFTCKSQQSLATLCRLAILFSHCRMEYQPQIKKTVIASILHAVQEGMQSQMASMIATFEADPVVSQLPSANDDTALYRISGWALKSTIENITKLTKDDTTTKDAQSQLDLLLSLKRHKDEKVFLPPGARYLDRGGLTFMHSSLLPWLHAVEASIHAYLNQDGYQKYGKDIFSVSLWCK
jgi:hypothetical protein